MGVPKVVVSVKNDMRLFCPGKRCAPPGLPHLPGGLQRSQSEPNKVLTCPGGWTDLTRREAAQRGADFQDRVRESTAHITTIGVGAWNPPPGTLRPNSSSASCGALGGRDRGLGVTSAGGGAKQGALQLRPHTTGTIGFDETKHHWYHPVGQAEQRRLATSQEPGSWAWMARKARDHVGYGDDGVVNWGDVQVSAVSADTPDWFVGPRTIPGPFGTRKHPVRRCPVAEIDGQKMRLRAKTFKIGEDLRVIETLHDTAQPPPPTPVERAAKPWEEYIQAKLCNLDHGGCLPKAPRRLKTPTVLPSKEFARER